MYEIILTTWYQDTPNTSYEEVYNGMHFESIEEAAEFLGKNIHEITNEFPVESITIKYRPLPKGGE